MTEEYIITINDADINSDITNFLGPQNYFIDTSNIDNTPENMIDATGYINIEGNIVEKFVHDKILESKKCGMERVDYQFECGTHLVYVEVDENQHQSYACECEQGRMINLVEQRGMPVRWIRYNPDVYEPMKGQRTIKLEQREKKLIEYTKWAMKNPPDTISSVLYLFYDEYDTKNQEWHKLI